MMCDDVFDDGDEGASSAEMNLMSKEFEKMNTSIEEIGFRDGFLQGKDESLQKGFDDGFNESFANFHAISRIKGLTLGMLMSSVDELSPEKDVPGLGAHSTPLNVKRKNLENIFQSLEDLEVALSDPERIKASGGISAISQTFDSLKEQLLTVVNQETAEAQSSSQSKEADLRKAISDCPSLQFTSLEKCLQDEQLFPQSSNSQAS